MTSASAPKTKPLAGLRVIDFTRVVSGPFCSMQLGDLGAEVIKVEHPVTGDDSRAWRPPEIGGESSYFISINRNKKSLALDLAKPQGRAVAFELAAKCDILVENFRPGVMKRWGLDFEALAAANPGLIYCAVSAYGQTGPMADRPGYDPVIQAEFGMMSVTGPIDGEPTRTFVPVIDTCAALYATIGILSAVVVRHTTGRGQLVDMSLMGAGVAMLGNVAQYYLTSGGNPPRMGNDHLTAVPTGLFHTEGGAIYISPSNDKLFELFCRHVIRKPEWMEDERFTTMAGRVRNADYVRRVTREAVQEVHRDELVARLNAAGVPGGPVRLVSEAMESPELAAAGMIAAIDHPTAGRLRMLTSPIGLSEMPDRTPAPPPLLGEHTAEILGDVLGYDDTRIDALRRAGIVRTLDR